jgi:hypothetical protein
VVSVTELNTIGAGASAAIKSTVDKDTKNLGRQPVRLVSDP